MTADANKPCPFCESDNVGAGWEGGHTVGRCFDCGAQGPTVHLGMVDRGGPYRRATDLMEKEAMRRWNARP